MRAASLGIRQRRKSGKGPQVLESQRTLPWETCFSFVFQQSYTEKCDLTNAFKGFFRDDSLEPCSKVAGFLGKQGLGFLRGARTRPRAQEAKGKAWKLPQTLKSR